MGVGEGGYGGTEGKWAQTREGGGKVMQLKVPWETFVEAALVALRGTYPEVNSPEFKQTNGYEPDSDCYNFPPSYVIISLEKPQEKLNASSV